MAPHRRESSVEKTILSPIELPWDTYKELTDHTRKGLFLDSQFYSTDLYAGVT